MPTGGGNCGGGLFTEIKNGTTAIEPTKYFAFCKHLTPYGVRGSAYCKA